MIKIIQFGLIVCAIVFLIGFGGTGLRGGMSGSSLKLILFAISGVLFFGFLLYLSGKSKKEAFTDTNYKAAQEKEHFKSIVEDTRLRKTDTLPRISLKDIENTLNRDSAFDKTEKALFVYKNTDKMLSIFTGKIFLLTEICELDTYIPYLKLRDIPYSRDGRSLLFDFTFKTSTDTTSPFINVDCKIHIQKQFQKMTQLIKIKEYSVVKKDLLVSHLKKELNLDDVNYCLSIQVKMFVSDDTIQLIAT